MASTESHGFRRWRRTRPFWGGVFAVLGGLELIAIPLAPMPLLIHQGTAGIASWLIGALLVTAGALMWYQPAHHSFYGVLAVLLSLVSFLTSNFGGFLAGLLLGLIGGALGFAWSSAPPSAESAPPARTSERAGPRRSRSGRFTALALPALLVLQEPHPTPTPPLFGILDPSTRPTPPLFGILNPSATPTPTPTPTPGKHGGKGGGKGAKPLVYAEPGTLRADSLTMSGLDFGGVVSLPTARGAVKALKFTMSKAVLKNVHQTSLHGGATAHTRTGNLTLTGNVVMLTTKMSSKLLGVPVTFTPEKPPPLTLRHMKMTDVVSEQPAVTANGARITGLDITSA